MFTITSHKGFQITFDNGWTISVQWGPGNYSAHHHDMDWNAPKRAEHWESPTAEVAAMHQSGPWYNTETGKVIRSATSVEGWCTSARVADLIAIVRALDANPVAPEIVSDEDVGE